MASTDQPALDDDVTARLFEQSVIRVRTAVFAPLSAVGVAALALLLWSTLPVFAVATVAFALVLTWQSVRCATPGGLQWVAAARRLLVDQPWRETPVTVLGTRRTVLALPDGAHVRAYGLPAPVREVVVRTRRVWVVGPDTDGWLAVRVAGLQAPWPARRVRARKAGPAVPTTEPVVTAWARHLVVRARGDLWFVVVATAVVTAIAARADGVWLAVGAAMCGAGCAAVVARELRRAARLRDAGPWRRADAAVPSWTHRRDGIGDGTITLRFPDGHRATARLDGVPIDLFATAWREETLWVAGGTAGGVVVGFPDYPLAAFARLTPET